MKKKELKRELLQYKLLYEQAQKDLETLVFNEKGSTTIINSVKFNREFQRDIERVILFGSSYREVGKIGLKDTDQPNVVYHFK